MEVRQCFSSRIAPRSLVAEMISQHKWPMILLSFTFAEKGMIINLFLIRKHIVSHTVSPLVREVGLIIMLFLLYLKSMGVVSFAIGLWLYISANEFAAISDGERLFGAAFLVSTGFGVLIVGFLGIVAALWESRIITTTVNNTIQLLLTECHTQL